MKSNKMGVYALFFKRPMDFILSAIALIVLSPILLLLAVIGAYKMKGNPFFVQQRPGKNERIFNLIKFRTMSNEKDENGNFLPDEVRLNAYGKFLRSTSLDELPELFNICSGDMSVVGPRPLLIEYLPWYTNEEHQRHSVRPGLTGWAQTHGRNNLPWDERFKADLFYIDNITFSLDVKIIVLTIKRVFFRENIVENTREIEPNFAEQRRRLLQNSRVGA